MTIPPQPEDISYRVSGIPPGLFGMGLSSSVHRGYKPQSVQVSDQTQDMPDQKLIRLCESISKESNPAKMTALLDELIQLLEEEQGAIRAKINANLKKSSLF